MDAKFLIDNISYSVDFSSFNDLSGDLDSTNTPVSKQEERNIRESNIK